MMYLIITRDRVGVDWKKEGTVLREEAKHIWELQKRNIVRSIWFTTPAREAVLFLEENTLLDAEKTLKAFPLVQKNLIDYEILQLSAYDGYERLFENV
jgi:hypothetical protein